MSPEITPIHQDGLSLTWKPIATAPKDRYILGFEAGMKRPYVMIWNVYDQQFSVSNGMEDETPTHWMDFPPLDI